MFERFFLRLFFKGLYKRYVSRGWSLISNAPDYMNIALPDFLVIYRMASFRNEDRVEIFGYKPRSCSYFSFTVYNHYGLPVDSLNDSKIPTNPFRIVIGKDLKKPDDDYYCLIYRVYRTDTRHIPHQPIIVINDKNLLPVPDSEIWNNTLQISPKIISHLEKRNLTIHAGFDFFSLPPVSKMSGLFPNQDARYLVLFPNISSTLIVRGKIDRAARFCGFMICDYKTTSTTESMNYLTMPTHYTFWVSTSLQQALKKGYQRDCPLLLWPPDGTPMLVYREVRVGSKIGLFSNLVKENDWRSAKKVMGVFYPRVEYLPYKQ